MGNGPFIIIYFDDLPIQHSDFSIQNGPNWFHLSKKVSLNYHFTFFTTFIVIYSQDYNISPVNPIYIHSQDSHWTWNNISHLSGQAMTHRSPAGRPGNINWYWLSLIWFISQHHLDHVCSSLLNIYSLISRENYLMILDIYQSSIVKKWQHVCSYTILVNTGNIL